MGTIGNDMSKVIGIVKNFKTVNVLVVGAFIITALAVIIVDLKNKIVDEYKSIKDDIRHCKRW